MKLRRRKSRTKQRVSVFLDHPVFIFIRQKLQHRMNNETEKQLRKKKRKKTQSLRHFTRAQTSSKIVPTWCIVPTTNIKLSLSYCQLYFRTLCASIMFATRGIFRGTCYFSHVKNWLIDWMCHMDKEHLVLISPRTHVQLRRQTTASLQLRSITARLVYAAWWRRWMCARPALGRI